MGRKPKTKKNMTTPGEALAKLLTAENSGASPQTRDKLAHAFEQSTKDYFKRRGVNVRIHITD